MTINSIKDGFEMESNMVTEEKYLLIKCMRENILRGEKKEMGYFTLNNKSFEDNFMKYLLMDQ